MAIFEFRLGGLRNLVKARELIEEEKPWDKGETKHFAALSYSHLSCSQRLSFFSSVRSALQTYPIIDICRAVMATNHFCSCGNTAYVFGFAPGQIKTTVCRDHIYTLTDKRVSVFDIEAFGFIETVEDGPLYERRKDLINRNLGSLAALESLCEGELAAAQTRLQASKLSVMTVVERCFQEMELRTWQVYEGVRKQLAQARTSLNRLLTSKSFQLSPNVSALCTSTVPLLRIALEDSTLLITQTLLDSFYVLPFVGPIKEVGPSSEIVPPLLDFARQNAENGRLGLAQEVIIYASVLEPAGRYPDYTEAAVRSREQSSEGLLHLLLNALTEQELEGIMQQEHFLQLGLGEAEVAGPVEQSVQDLQLNVKCGLANLRVSAQQVDEAPCVVTISAAGGHPHDSGVSLVCVLDYSSPASDFQTVKSVLLRLVDQLGDSDFLAIVRFSSYAEQVCPLTQSKTKLRSLVQSLEKPQSSNFAKAFLLGLNALKQRPLQQKLRMLLFSDGGHSANNVAICQTALQHCKLPVYCWAGVDARNAELLQGLARQSGGAFTFLTRAEQVSEVCTFAFGSARSVVASNLLVSIEVKPGPVLCELVKVYTEGPNNPITIQELRTNEDKHLVFLLRPNYQHLVNSVRLPIVHITLRYEDNEGTETEKTAILDLKFVRWEGPGSSKDTNVYAHWYCAWGRDCLRQASDLAALGEQGKAETVLRRGVEAIMAGASREVPIVQAVLKELEEAKEQL